VPQREVNAIGLLGVQAWIADVENENARMWPIVIKLFESRGAKRVLVVSYERATPPEGHAHTRAAGESHKVTLAEVPFRVVAILLNTSAELKTNALEVNSLQTKNGKGMLLSVRGQSLLANRFVISGES
jgi:hypothetical protein